MTGFVYQCRCGCGEGTGHLFARGHDGRMFGQVVRGERPADDLRPFPAVLDPECAR